MQNEISDTGAKALAANNSIVFLDIGLNNLSVEGAKALAANGTLSTLKIGHNLIENAGAIVLAATTTLTTLDISGNKISDEYAAALAANTTITSLNISDSQVTDESAKALMANMTLTFLDTRDTHITAEANKQLAQAITRNKQFLIQNQNQLIQGLILLAWDKANSNSQSLWSTLPKDMMFNLINMIDFNSADAIGKAPEQIKACSTYLFNNTLALTDSLDKVKKDQKLQIIEKKKGEKTEFKFFLSPRLPNASQPKQITEEIDRLSLKK